MTTKQTIGAIAMAALLVLAGCSSAVPGTNTNAQTDDGDVDGVESVGSADLTFYISDRPGAIEDFEHLNVTITKVGLHKASDDANETEEAEETEEADETSANDTTAATENADLVETTAEDPNETTYTMTTSEETETTTDTETETEETETEETESEETESEETESEETETEETESEEADSEGEDGEKGSEWVMKDVDNETVDLTKLQGANATAIGNLSVPAGQYDKVFVYVSDVNATLTNGESVNVKLPSSKLQINKNFELSANSSPDFVFDINVHEAGGSGKYILRPIVSESGTGDQVEIEKVDKNGKPENPGAKGDEGAKGGDDDADDEQETAENETEDGESASSLEAALAGDVRVGEDVTVSVTNADGPVENATVEVNGETVGETNADGELTFTVPDAEELEVTVTKGDAETELERDVKGGDGGGDGYGDVQSLSGYALA